MVSMNEIIEQFEEFGISASDEVLAKCIDLCVTYDITDATEFVEQWMAYSVSYLEGAEPTVQFLLEMERKELIPQKAKKDLKKKSKPKPSIGNYGSPSVNAMADMEPMVDEPDDEFMDAYMCNTPKTQKKALPRTPVASQHKNNSILFSPASYSPLSGTPRSSGTEGSGKPVYTFGKANVIEQTKWTSTREKKVQIKQLLTYNNEPLTTKSKYMYDSLTEKSLILGDRLYYTATEICKHHFGKDVTEYDLENVDTMSQEKVKIIGRIACDFDGKLDRHSTIIVGTDELKLRTTRLNFNNMKSFAVFPGQTIIASGVNPRGDTFYANEIFTDRSVTPPNQPDLTEPMTLVVAAGPFTHHEDLVYDPLHELILYCKDHKPDALILIGPFIDADHQLITSNALSETFDQCFEKMVASVVEALGDVIICMVSSHRDAVSHIVYPTPPNMLKRPFPDVHLLPDPSILEISGLKIGITSTDIVGHLLDEELSQNAGDKVKRIVNYMLNESSFYPLNPPVMDMCVDSELANKFARLDEPPHVLILPSKEKCFIRDINNCLTINPGCLSSANGAGMFARITVNPPKEGTRLADYVASQVVRI